MKSKNNFVGKLRSVSVLVVVLLLIVASCFVLGGCQGDNNRTEKKKPPKAALDIDTTGGVEAVFVPDFNLERVTDSDLNSAKQIVESRLLYNNITDYEVNVDYDNKQITVRFPWQSADKSYNPMNVINELGKQAMLTFYKGSDNTGEIAIQGSSDIKSASYGGYDANVGSYCIRIEMTNQGATKFAAATKAQIGKSIAIYLDDTLLTVPVVNAEITDGNVIITGMASAGEAIDLAEMINAGSMPFELVVDESKLKIVYPAQ